MRMNRLANCKNEFQGAHKKVLCVCSAGLLRSPTAAVVLSAPPFNYNTRAAGCVPEYALVPVDEVLLKWADEIVCMEPAHAERLKYMIENSDINMGEYKEIILLEIPDNFEYRSPELMKLIEERYIETKGI